MPPNFYHQVSFSRRQFSLARLFFFRHDFSKTLPKKMVPKTKSRAQKTVVPPRKVVPKKKTCQKKKVVPEKTDVVKRKLDDKS